MCFALLIGSGVALWRNGEPWECAHVLRGHRDDVRSAAFSADGERIVTGSADCMAQIWDVRSGSSIATLSGHAREIESVQYSRNGTRILTASLDGTARLWDANSGKVLLTLDGHTKPLISALFSPDDRMIGTTSWDGTARIWDSATAMQLSTIAGSPNANWRVVFSPDSQRAVIRIDDRHALITDSRTGAESARVQVPSMSCVQAFSPCNRFIATAGYVDSSTADRQGPFQYNVYVFDAISGAETHVLRGYRWHATWIEFSPDGKQILTGSYELTARLWDTQTGSLLGVLEDYPGAAQCKDWRVGGVGGTVHPCFDREQTRILTGVGGTSPQIWDARALRHLAVLRGHRLGVTSANFSPDGQFIATSSYDDTARIWRRRRPEWWWGIAWLPEFWAALVCAVLFGWSVRREFSESRRRKAEGGDG